MALDGVNSPLMSGGAFGSLMTGDKKRAAALSANQSAKDSHQAVRDEFLREAKKTPIERLREQYLDRLGLSEEALAKLPPEQRNAIESEIQKAIKEKFAKQATGQQQTKDEPRSFASYLQL